MATTAQGRHLGSIPSTPDARDYPFTSALPPASLPAHVDRRPELPPVYYQDALGSCTAFAAGALFRHARRLAHGWPLPHVWRASNRYHGQVESVDGSGTEDYDIAFLAQYYWSRGYSGDQNSDDGAQPRDALKTLAKRGAASWHNFEYDILQWDTPPSALVSANAANHKIKTYHKLETGSVLQVRQALASGHVVFIGMTVYQSFEDAGDYAANKGIVPMPNLATELPIGGHAVVAVGYDDAAQRFIIRNSWGGGWGVLGHCFIPYAMVADGDLVQDAWLIDSGAS